MEWNVVHPLPFKRFPQLFEFLVLRPSYRCSGAWWWKDRAHVFPTACVIDLILLPRQPIFRSLEGIKIINGINSRTSSCARILTSLFVWHQSFDKIAHRRFQVREEFGVDIVQASDKFTVVHEPFFSTQSIQTKLQLELLLFLPEICLHPFFTRRVSVVTPS